MSTDPIKPPTIHCIRIVYKSGHTEEFNCIEFSCTRGSYSWKSIGRPFPLLIGADDIAAIWQVGERLATEQEMEQLGLLGPDPGR